MKVIRQRTEFRTHTFELPDGVHEDSDEAQEMYHDFDWGDASTEHAEEENLQVIHDYKEINLKGQ